MKASMPSARIGVEFCQHLIGIADDRGAAAGSRATDARPEIVLRIAFRSGAFPQLGLTANTSRLAVQRTRPDRSAGIVVET